MNNRINISSGSPYESVVGYSRAVISGNSIEVSGTTASENGKVISPDSLYDQTVFILEKIKKVLEEAGSSMQQVTRTRMYVTDISRWKEAAKGHLLYFETIRPASTMVEVKALIDPEMLIEIEVTAVSGTTF
ncbi:RidA family protein [soil metagenome]